MRANKPEQSHEISTNQPVQNNRQAPVADKLRGPHSRLFGFFWAIFVIFLITLSFTAAFYLTAFILQRTFLHPPALLVQIINSFLGLLFTGLIVSAFSRFFRRQQINAFLPVIQAMERIAKGDFSIRLDTEHEDGILSSLVGSVNKMALELGQMESMRQEFISNVSHEIQSPLTSIRGFAQALQNENLSPQDRQHYLQIIETESRRLSRLADDLLKLASLETDQVKFEPKPYRLDKQIKSLVLLSEPQWTEKNIDMDISLEEISITADEDLLNQVWLNLLHNSIKFTPPNGAILLKLVPHGNTIQFSITDTGIGIAPEDRMHIFERFYKADKSRTRSKEGSGLGLSIVKRIIDLHHGSIDLESEPGKGSTFTISLPVTPKE
jgi:two-component system, OmpR family, phosphate regulon sensor histidine kinase PhoR